MAIKKSQTGRRKQSKSLKPKPERRAVSNPRRKSTPKKEDELYTLPTEDIKEFIKKERRHDELDQIREVQIQKRTWNRTVFACFILNLTFLILAVIGSMAK